MSRIFDAIRKSEQEKGTAASSTSWPLDGPIQEQGAKKEGRALPNSYENVESIKPHITPDKHILAFADGQTPGAEKFRVLRHRLQKIRADQPLGKLLISSPVPREGKTLVAVNLAFSLSRVSPKVLLVDADLRHPGVHEVLGLGPMAGLTEYLEGKIDEHQAVRRLDPWNFYYMPAGNCPANPGELLQGPRAGELVKKLGEAFDWVIIDTAPITLFADTPQLANFVDATLLVSRLGVTPPDTLEQAVMALEGNYIAGIILNGDRDTGHNHYGYYHYGSKDSDLEIPAEKKAEGEKG